MPSEQAPIHPMFGVRHDLVVMSAFEPTGIVLDESGPELSEAQIDV
jgi:hypothetical protein